MSVAFSLCSASMKKLPNDHLIAVVEAVDDLGEQFALNAGQISCGTCWPAARWT
jgi:hypothetical protein